jgi:5-methylthioadenosine/S-adenosylhomocysteine deaminase
VTLSASARHRRSEQRSTSGRRCDWPPTCPPHRPGPATAPTTAPATEIIRAATIDGARALGIDDRLAARGRQAPTRPIDLDAPHLTPVHDLSALLVFAAGRGDVTDVFVDGRHVVQDRKSTLIDTSDLLLRAGERGRVAANAAKDA